MEHISKELNIGRAGEYIALADLILKGEKAFLTDQGMNYDLVVDKEGKMIRLQVKTTQKIRTSFSSSQNRKSSGYFFHLRRAGKGAKRRFEIGEFEGFALVILDKKEVFYFPFIGNIPNALVFRDRETDKGKNILTTGRRLTRYIQDYTWDEFKQICKK